MADSTPIKAGKRRWGLLPWLALPSIVDAMEVGAAKYGAAAWEDLDPDQYFEAATRHLLKHRAGQYLDPEDDIPHLAHAGASVLIYFALTLRQIHGQETEIIVQEAPLPEKAREVIARHLACRRA